MLSALAWISGSLSVLAALYGLYRLVCIWNGAT